MALYLGPPYLVLECRLDNLHITYGGIIHYEKCPLLTYRILREKILSFGNDRIIVWSTGVLTMRVISLGCYYIVCVKGVLHANMSM